MPLELQPKLLRVLQENEVTPVGAPRPLPVNAQVIAATNRDLESEVAHGRFREDLYYRLNMVELAVPPLREQAEDIPTFMAHFSKKYACRYSRELWEPDRATLQQFCEYHWPGNIRQLSHVIEQSYILDCTPMVPDRTQRKAPECSLPFTDLARLRRTAVRQALAATGGHKGRAAALLGVHPNTMTRLLSRIRAEDSDGDREASNPE